MYNTLVSYQPKTIMRSSQMMRPGQPNRPSSSTPSQLSMPPRQLRRLRSGRLPIAETQLGALLPPLDAGSR
jgi:hypothetical protein